RFPSKMNKEISELREMLKPDLPKLTSMEVDDLTLRRYLIAFCKITAAHKAILATNAWRSEFNVPNISSESPGVSKFQAMKCSIPLEAYDKGGRSVLYCAYRNYKKEGRDIKQLTVFIVYILETLISKCRDVDNFCIIVDMKDFTIASMDYGAVTTLFKVMQDHYPERLGFMLIINAPTVFSVSWNIVKKWLNERTSNKIVFLEESNLNSYIDPASVPLHV
ncbi:unnamed protein product, partial [Meganyctiphanes norvegica]